MEDGLATVQTLEEASGEIFLTQGYDRENPKKITRKEIYKSERTLGIRINLMQDIADEVKYRHEKIIKWAVAINSSRLYRRDVSMTYYRVLLAMVTYPVTITTMTASDLSNMQITLDKSTRQKFTSTGIFLTQCTGEQNNTEGSTYLY